MNVVDRLHLMAAELSPLWKANQRPLGRFAAVCSSATAVLAVAFPDRHHHSAGQTEYPVVPRRMTRAGAQQLQALQRTRGFAS